MRSKMKPLTVRNLPPGVARAVRDKARKERLSLNGAVVKLLGEATGVDVAPGRLALHDDLDRFASAWTAKEADAFDAALEEMRGVRPEDWR